MKTDLLKKHITHYLADKVKDSQAYVKNLAAVEFIQKEAPSIAKNSSSRKCSKSSINPRENCARG